MQTEKGAISIKTGIDFFIIQKWIVCVCVCLIKQKFNFKLVVNYSFILEALYMFNKARSRTTIMKI